MSADVEFVVVGCCLPSASVACFPLALLFFHGDFRLRVSACVLAT